jgi:hypothetical protein
MVDRLSDVALGVAVVGARDPAALPAARARDTGVWKYQRNTVFFELWLL